MKNRIRLQPLVKMKGREVFGYEILYLKKDESYYPSAVSILETIAFSKGDGRNCKYFINMTHKDAVDPLFVKKFLKALDKTNVDRNMVILEISEKSILDELPQMKENFRTFYLNGIRLALDDFGANLSTLEFMNNFPLEIIKIDKDVVQNAIKSHMGYSLFKLCVEVSHDIGCSVVAEGIENNEQLDCVMEIGAEIGQGFIFSTTTSENDGTKSPFIPFSNFADYLSMTTTLACVKAY